MPTLHPERRPRRMAGFDMFRKSELKTQLVEIPYTSNGGVIVGTHMTRIKAAWDSLSPEQRAAFVAEAEEYNAKQIAEELEESGSVEEGERAR